MKMVTTKMLPLLRYQGKSMWPCFQDGDLLEIMSVAANDVTAGDCITYRLHVSERTITHRVIAIQYGQIVTRGDAFSKVDDYNVTDDQLIGRVVGRFRLGSRQRVWGGAKGRLAGWFFHFAGRFDPQRQTRGGNAARRLRKNLQWLICSLYSRGVVKDFPSDTKDNRRFWLLHQTPWARFDRAVGWVVPWPRSLLIDPAYLPAQNRTDTP